MLEIVQACQGAIVGGYCQPVLNFQSTCAFHRATVELEHAVTQVLSRWNLAHLEKTPGPVGKLPGTMHCLMAGVSTTVSPKARVATARATKGTARP